MQLDIILRTHDGNSVHPRRFDKPKKDIVWRSVRSLMTAIKNVDGCGINLTVIDDHSTQETKDFFRRETRGINSTVVGLKNAGNNASMLVALAMGKESKADLVYIVEDDYLHQPDALSVALDTWKKFYPKNPFPLMGMSLVDCASNYDQESRDGSAGYIVGGTDRPWRTIEHTGVTFLLENGVLQKHWQPFEEIARYWPYFEERITFNKLWNTQVGMYCPLVPLAYHLWENHPFYPVDDLWETNKCLELVA